MRARQLERRYSKSELVGATRRLYGKAQLGPLAVEAARLQWRRLFIGGTVFGLLVGFLAGVAAAQAWALV